MSYICRCSNSPVSWAIYVYIHSFIHWPSLNGQGYKNLQILRIFSTSRAMVSPSLFRQRIRLSPTSLPWSYQKRFLSNTVKMGRELTVPVLIVGAGPVGLVLSILLAKLGECIRTFFISQFISNSYTFVFNSVSLHSRIMIRSKCCAFLIKLSPNCWKTIWFFLVIFLKLLQKYLTFQYTGQSRLLCGLD